MKIALIGGHMAPALGFIDVLPKSTQIIYIGRKYVFEGDSGISLEQQVIEKRNIRFIPFTTGRIQRSFTKQTIPSLLKIPHGFSNAWRILKKEKLDVVVGFGGYLSVPLGIAAKILGIPLVIHESTLGIGLANKVLAPFADKICISWNSSREYFPQSKTVLTGDPLLPFSAGSHHIPSVVSKENLPLVVVSGGSGGSHVINATISQILPELLEIAKVIHQTGDAKEFGDFQKLSLKKKKLPKALQARYAVLKFIHPESMNSLLAASDLIVGRSGINTVTTLLVLRKKAVFIPLSTGQKNEQLNNAKLMESEGLATILLQKNLSPKNLFLAIQKAILQKPVAPKWQIPVIKNGAENLMKEVLSCKEMSHKE